MQSFITTATITRLANATPYTAGTLLSASNSQGVASTLAPVNTTNNEGGLALWARLMKSTTSLTAATFRLHVFTNLPTLSLAGLADGGAFTGPTTTDAGIYVGYFDFLAGVAVADGASFEGAPSQSTLLFKPAPGVAWTPLWVVVEVLSAYTPGTSEVFTIILGTVSEP